MDRTAFLPYYLTLFTFSVCNGWPSVLSFLEERSVEERSSFFRGAQLQRFMAFSEGLNAYFEAPPVSTLPLPLQYQEGETLFIIPSLLMPPSLFHLMPEHSFLNFLIKKKINPYVLDWRASGLKDLSFEAFEKSCIHAYTSLCASSSNPPFVIGINDGIFFALSLAKQASLPQGIIFMGEPEGIFQHAPLLRGLFLPFFLPFLENSKSLSPALTRLFFSMGQSEKVVQKISAFKTCDQKKLFIAVEDCLNQLSLCPSFLAKSYLSGDFSNLYPKQGIVQTLQTIPTLLFQPQQKSLTFLEGISFSSQVLRPHLGNFGLLTSSFAPLHVWDPLVKWLEKTKIGITKCQVLQSSQGEQEESAQR